MKEGFEHKIQEEFDVLLNNGVMGLLTSSENTDYYYDSISNTVIRVGPIISEIVECLLEKEVKNRLSKIILASKRRSPNQVYEALSKINTIRIKKGIFRHFPKDIEFVITTDENEKRELNGLVLGITENCNFRCTYCTASGRYINEGKHNDAHMPLPIALKSIDYFFDHANRDYCYISFYGGEPLLKKDLVYECMQYARRINPNVSFNLQTNGYLLDSHFFNILRKFDSIISISLDGPKEIHDNGRLTASGKGTYDKIMENIESMADIDFEFLKKKMAIKFTLDSLIDIEDIIEFYNNHPILSNVSVYASLVNFHGLKEHLKEEKSKELSIGNLELARQRYKEGMIDGIFDGIAFESSLFSRWLEPLASGGRVSSKMVPCGPCILGGMKLFVNVKGQFMSCEKTERLPVIGDIENGLYWDVIEKMENEFLSNCEPCRECWAISLCRLCWVNFYPDASGQSQEYIREQCKGIRAKQKYLLKTYIEIIEKNPKAFTNLLNENDVGNEKIK
jgi:uncharacterized protein